MNTLVIADPHEDASHPMYLDFCVDLWNEWECERVVIMGDVADNHWASTYGKRPGLPGPDEEIELTRAKLWYWHATFPVAKVLIGNHDERITKRCEEVGVSTKWLQWYSDMWETPGWEWQYHYRIDDVQYLHGTGRGGKYPAVNQAIEDNVSTVMGHIHTVGGCWWSAKPDARVFGMNVGCGVDVNRPNFDYEKTRTKKPLLGAGIVIGPTQKSKSSMGIFIPMPCANGEAYHRSKA